MKSDDQPIESIHVLKDETKEGSTIVASPWYGLISAVTDRYNQAKTQRLFDEQRWLAAYRNFRGLYDASMRFRDEEKSRVFVKITKTKVLAAYGQLLEVLFSTGKFPLSIQATEMPEGVAQTAHLGLPGESSDADEPPVDIYGHPGDGMELPPGATYSTLLGGLAKKYDGANLVQGPAANKQQSPEVHPSEEAAANMEKVIMDQLGESKAENVVRHVLFEMALLGHGVMKGPFSLEKTYNKWVPSEQGGMEYFPDKKLMPTIEATSVWNFYPDPNAINIDSCEWVIERHAYNRSEMRQLLNRPFFREEAVRAALESGPNYTREWWEDRLKDSQSQQISVNRFEVLEYWGVMDTDLAMEAGLELPDNFDEVDEVQVNIWICGPHLLRLVINPFTPSRIPYQACPFELNPFQFFGVGIPENMDDCQMIMNGHARMAIDNLALAGNLVFDIDETSLVPGQDMKIYPGKIFRRQAGTAGQAVYGLKFPSTASDNLAMFDKFRQLADEATGIPSYSHGDTGVQSTTRTAAGMSMLMGAAALNIKTVIKNVDDFLIRPLGEALFAWNMQFNKDVPEIRGDLEIKARGTASLLAKEVKSQRLMTFLQLTSNPAIAPYIKISELVKEVAETMDVDADKIINDPDEAAIQAQIIGAAGGMQQSGSPPAPPDQTGAGGGNIGTGAVPVPGEAQFSGNPSSSNAADGTSANG